ncbi:uncharacterized protein LOC135843155 isoform X2 [Planococcus citri]|uniref:uncharacterized protein LOC135843155 isoform X2 n=1 Tax=Planococcus citri TaxID=170843 RepID=UPI0031F8993D
MPKFLSLCVMKKLSLIICLLEFITIHSSFGVVYKEFICQNLNVLGRPQTDCFGDGEILTLPNSIGRNVQELNVEAFLKSSFAINSIDTFARFENLSVLDIRTGKSFHVDEKLQKPDTRDQLRKYLFHLPKLETLIIHYEEFNDVNNSWVLPPNLKELHLHHSVLEFDLNSCSVLETLIFNNNKLKKMPTLPNPPPPLRVLSLTLETSLDDFTVDDIAPLCTLRRLELVMYASEDDHKRRCECNRLKEFISGLDLPNGDGYAGEYAVASDVNLICPIDDPNDCDNYTLDDAWKKREMCLWSHYGVVPRSLIKNLIVFVLMVIVIAVLITSYGIHCFRMRPKRTTFIVEKKSVL